MIQEGGWVRAADPAWHRIVLQLLERDFPEIADEAWRRAVGENAAGRVSIYGAGAAALLEPPQ